MMGYYNTTLCHCRTHTDEVSARVVAHAINNVINNRPSNNTPALLYGLFQYSTRNWRSKNRSQIHELFATQFTCHTNRGLYTVLNCVLSILFWIIAVISENKCQYSRLRSFSVYSVSCHFLFQLFSGVIKHDAADDAKNRKVTSVNTYETAVF